MTRHHSTLAEAKPMNGGNNYSVIPAALRRTLGAIWRPALVGSSLALGWSQSGPAIDLQQIIATGGRVIFGESIPTHCSSIMIGYACSLENGNPGVR